MRTTTMYKYRNGYARVYRGTARLLLKLRGVGVCEAGSADYAEADTLPAVDFALPAALF